jgi:hypothetical protein
MPRYTRIVPWLPRTATVVLVLLLGGGPTVAAVCQALCIAPAEQETAPSEVTEQHHHQPAPAAHQHHPARGVEAAHAHHQTGEAHAAASHSHLSSVLGQDCCRKLAKSRVSLAASRIDTDLLPGSHAALLRTAAILWVADRYLLGPTHGPPPGDLSPVRAPLVLRI